MPIGILLLPLLLLLTLVLLVGIFSLVYAVMSVLVGAVHPHRSPRRGRHAHV